MLLTEGEEEPEVEWLAVKLPETHVVLEIERLGVGEDVDEGQKDGDCDTVEVGVTEVLPLCVTLLEPVRVTDTV